MIHKKFQYKNHASSQQAHRELFENYCNYVYTIVFNRLRSCASREDIEECVCDVFVDFYIYYDSARDPSGDISGFIGTIARRKAAEIYKRKSARLRETPVISIDEDDSRQLVSDQNIENETEKKEQRRIILDKIAELGEPDSTILIQKYYYGRSAKEIADMVSLTPENIRVRSGRAVKRLGEILEKNGITL